MKKIGILGGTYNPVHAEHIKIAEAAVKELALDKLFVMPTFLSPHKTVAAASCEDRLNMLRLAFDGAEKIEVSDYEISKGGKSFSYLTVEEFKTRFPDAQLYFICGSDMLTDFKTWRFPERILASCDLAVFDREDFIADYDAEKEYFKTHFSKGFIKLGYSGKTSSSTKIRVYTSFKLPTPFALPCVNDYIKTHGLYSPDKYTAYIADNLKPSRVVHTAGVVISALKKCKELSLDAEKVRITATLHDCAKYFSAEDFPECPLPENVPSPVVHAFLGAYVAEKILGITDAEILDAIRYHSSGKPKMSTLGKLIFVADMIEEGRDYPGVDNLRQLYCGEFNACFKECLKEETEHLKSKKQEVFEETFRAYEYYVVNNNV